MVHFNLHPQAISSAPESDRCSDSATLALACATMIDYTVLLCLKRMPHISQLRMAFLMFQ